MPRKPPMSRPSGIYAILCIPNGYVWIGQSRDIPARWLGHKSALNANKNSPHLQRAWNKYGPESFVWGIVQVSPPSRLDSLEESWISKLDSGNRNKGFNIETTARGRGEMCSEIKGKISDWHKGRPKTEEHRKKLSEALKGKRKHPMSEESKKKLSEALQGKKRTPEQRKRISEAQTGTKRPRKKDSN